MDVAVRNPSGLNLAFESLNVIGTINSDIIQGKDGNGTITGGGGNDYIDGAEALPVFGSQVGRFFALFHDGGPDAPLRFRSAIGGLLPITLCGQTSL